METDNKTEGLLLSLASLTANLTNVVRPERMYTSVSWESLILSTSTSSVFLNPCSGSATVSLGCESWLSSSSSESSLTSSRMQVQVQVETDCVYLDVGPRHLTTLNRLLEDYRRIQSGGVETNVVDDEDGGKDEDYNGDVESASFNLSQHYKDDLKSGAFQFIDGTAEELPFPYQV